MTTKSIAVFFAMFLFTAPIFCSDESAEIQNQVKLMDENALQIGNEKALQSMSGRLGVPVETLKTQREQTNLGLGNIFVANALAKASGKEFSTLVQEFQTGKGWGEIGKSYGVKLGSVVSQLKRSNQATERMRIQSGGEQKQTRERTSLSSGQSNRGQTRNSTGRGR